MFLRSFGGEKLFWSYLWVKEPRGIDEVLKLEPTFEYDDFEEVYFSPKGIFIETDPETDTIIWISVYIKELDNENFIEGNWLRNWLNKNTYRKFIL